VKATGSFELLKIGNIMRDRKRSYKLLPDGLLVF